MIDLELIDLAKAELRRKASAGRRSKLTAAGVPTAEHKAALARWILTAEDRNAVEAGCVFHAEVVRLESGIDHELPTLGRHGCRVTCSQITARIDEAITRKVEGTWWEVTGDRLEPYGLEVFEDTTAEAMVEMRRQQLLARNDYFATRAEADDAVTGMLAARHARTQGNKIRNRIKATMKTLGVSQRELAKRLGWPQQNVNRYLSGAADMVSAKVSLILDELGLELRQA